MSTVKTNNVQIGQSVTATNNFTWYQPSSPDGTVRLGNGNAGSVTDLVTVNSSGNVGIGTSSPGATLNVVANTSSDALRITQTGAGNALVVEDSANPDSTPFVVDANGRLVIGNSTPRSIGGDFYPFNIDGADYTNSSAALTNNSNNSNPVLISLGKTRSTSAGGVTVVQSGDNIGRLDFRGADGTGLILAANISAAVDGTPGTNDMPGRLVFSTTADGSSSPTERLRLDSSGNLGLGVTPSGWASTWKVLQNLGGFFGANGSSVAIVGSNSYSNGTNWIYQATGAASNYAQVSGVHSWSIAPSGTAGNAISFTQAMTLDASGNLLVGTTTSTARLTTTSAGAEGTVEVSFINGGCQFFVNSVGGANAAATVQRIGRISTNSRSINAGGTINASGADYAEYMIKAGDFEIAKGEVCGIDANGLLTNVFADAVSFVVKSTDPSYVGGDSWGAEIEDADALEIARQKVDRIAFAGQVPVNVLGAKAGDYIIPIADGTGIKGTAVASPTFEQYQIAVGKVIAIESDGRARIIVKVA